MMTNLHSLRYKIATAFSKFGTTARVLILFATLTVAALIFLWSFNQIFFFFATKTYADEISQAYNLNKGFTRALLWGSFGLVAFFSGCTFSLSKIRRTVGYLGILVLLIGHGILLGLRDSNYDTAGNAQKCYVLTRDGIKVLNHVGTDPETGRECKLLTPQMVEKYNAYKNGRRPQLVTDADPIFFDPVSGESVVWFSQVAGRVNLFDLMGFDPRTGEELKPIDRTTIEQWRTQSTKMARRVPNRILDPEKFGFFDPMSGKSKIWYWASVAGEYEFYDGPGFHQKFGDELKIITSTAISDWRKNVEEKRKAEERKAQENRNQVAKELAEQKAAAEARAAAERQQAEAAARKRAEEENQKAVEAQKRTEEDRKQTEYEARAREVKKLADENARIEAETKAAAEIEARRRRAAMEAEKQVEAARRAEQEQKRATAELLIRNITASMSDCDQAATRRPEGLLLWVFPLKSSGGETVRMVSAAQVVSPKVALLRSAQVIDGLRTGTLTPYQGQYRIALNDYIGRRIVRFSDDPKTGIGKYSVRPQNFASSFKFGLNTSGEVSHADFTQEPIEASQGTCLWISPLIFE